MMEPREPSTPFEAAAGPDVSQENGRFPEERKPPEQDPLDPLPPPAPVTVGGRVQALDVVRGVAIFGILVVNLQSFAYPPSAFEDPALLEPLLGELTIWDRLARFVTSAFFEMKFITIFSIWFGVSLQLLAGKWFQRGEDPAEFLFRRFAFLALLGLAHGLILWYGDILLTYGAIGIVAIATLRHFSPRLLLGLACPAFLAPICMLMLFGLLTLVAPEEHLEDDQAKVARVTEEIRIFSEGSYGEIFLANAMVWGTSVVFVALFFSTRVIGSFWIGMSAVQLGLVFDRNRRIQVCRRLALFCLPLGLLIEVPRAAWETFSHVPIPWALLVDMPVQYVGSLILALGYIGVLVLWAESTFLERIQTGIAALGQMALTNYLTHTVVFTTLFYAYGFGLHSQVPIAALPLLAVAMVTLQIPLSRLWLSRFRFGPVEWLWRSASYGKLQPLRRGDGPNL